MSSREIPEESAPGPGAARIDRWLFGTRLFKSRSLATRAVSGGKVHVNGERVRPSHSVRDGDLVSFIRGTMEYECTVAGIPQRRGPASVAQHYYVETPASAARRAQLAERAARAAIRAPRPQERPDKHARRQLRRLRGRN